jgi:outer membrane immunogenic protein
MRWASFAIIAASFAAPGLVQAADPIGIPLSDSLVVPVAEGESSFDWSGFYAGVYGVAGTSPVGGDQAGLGVVLGANARFDYVLVGGEVSIQGLTGGAGDTAYVEGLGRIGVAATDEIMVFAAAGLGADLGGSEVDALIGGGLEFVVSDDVTVRGQYLHGYDLAGGNPKDQVTLGANFHF